MARATRPGCTGCSSPAGVLPQAADAAGHPARARGPTRSGSSVARLNLDAASFRQLFEKHGGDGDAVRAEVLDIVADRGKMHNPVTGSGGMLTGTVAEVGPRVAARASRSATRSRPWSR